jgi:hypothetical protein
MLFSQRLSVFTSLADFTIFYICRPTKDREFWFLAPAIRKIP